MGWCSPPPTPSPPACGPRAGGLGGPGRAVGLANYGLLLSDPQFLPALRLTVLGTLAHVVAVAILPPLLAIAAAAAGRGLRLAARLLFTLPLAMASPIAIAATMLVLVRGRNELAGVATAPLAVIRTQSLYACLIAAALGLVFYVAALRAEPGRPLARTLTSRPFVALWLITALATAAWALQSYALPYIVTGGGPRNATTTLPIYAFAMAFRDFHFGPATATATLELVALLAAGTACGFLLIWSRARIVVTRPADGGGPTVHWAVIAIVAVVAVLLLLAGTLPLMGTTFAPGRAFDQAARAGFTASFLHTLWPSIPQVVIVLTLSALAGAGIGLCRPLGDHSEWLLMPFAPWLFVTTQPLAAAAFAAGAPRGGLATAQTVLWPALQYGIVAMVVLTLLFAGLSRAWHDARARRLPDALLRHGIAPALPMVLGLGALMAWLTFHQLDWPLISISSRAGAPGTLWILQLSTGSTASFDILHAAVTLFELPLVIVFTLGYWAFQAFYAERLAISEPPPAAFPPR